MIKNGKDRFRIARELVAAGWSQPDAVREAERQVPVRRPTREQLRSAPEEPADRWRRPQS